MKPLVYVVTGVSGAGKSWVCSQLSTYAKYIPYDKVTLADAINEMKTSEVPILYDPTTNVSTFISKSREYLDVRLVVILGDFLKVKQQLLNRGGKVTKSLYRRWRRMNSLKNRAVFSGDSSEVYKWLKSELESKV